jgi:hypothetical protein
VVVPFAFTLYNQGTLLKNHPGTDGLEFASQETGKSHEEERGVKWKNVSKA